MPERRSSIHKTFERIPVSTNITVYFGRHVVGDEPLFTCDLGQTVWPPDIRADIDARQFNVVAVDGLRDVFQYENMPCNRELIEKKPPLIVLGADMPVFSNAPLERQASKAWETVFERLRMEDPSFKPPGGKDFNSFVSEQVEHAYKKEAFGVGASLFTANVLMNLMKNRGSESNVGVPNPARRALLRGFFAGLGGAALSAARRPIFIMTMNAKAVSGDSIVGDIARVTVPFTVKKVNMELRNARLYLATSDYLNYHPKEKGAIVLGTFHQVGAQTSRQWVGKAPAEARMLSVYQEYITPVVKDLRGSIDKEVLYQTLWELFSRYTKWQIKLTAQGYVPEIVSDHESIPVVNALLRELVD